jgi:hypothetical protein
MVIKQNSRTLMRLTFKRSLLVLALGILFALTIWSNNNTIFTYGQNQAAPTDITTTPTIKITSPTKGQPVPPGELTITGISSDDVTSDCTVYTDWNDLKPMQQVTPTGSSGGGEGTDDYSSWTFTYSQDYHLITEGPNELTSKISCDNRPSNITKSYSVNVTGVATGQGQQQQGQKLSLEQEEGVERKTTGTQSSETSNDGNTPLTLPFSSDSSDIEEGSAESREGGGVTANKQDNDDIVNPNDDNEPTIYWDLD